MSGKVFDTDDEPGCARKAGWESHARWGVEPEPVTCRTVVALLEEGAALPVMAELRYDSAEPYSVTMAFNAGSDPVIEWEFGRDLLASGRRRLDGFGDVQVWPDEIRGHGLVYLSFRAGRETFVVAASAIVIDEFLTATFDVVPLGKERSSLGPEGFAVQL